MADWSGLPFDIIHEISTYLITIEDFLSFSAVCHSWRSVYLAKQWHPGPQIPMLMCSDYANSSSRSFISLYTNRVYNLEIPDIRGRRCWGSCTGWLVTSGNDREIHLLNPFTRVSICLPPTSPLQIYFGKFQDWLKRAYVFRHPCTSDGNENDLVVMIIYGNLNHLAVCRPGYSSWRNVKADDEGWFTDVTCLKGQIFALDYMGSLVVIDVESLECVSVIDISIQYNPLVHNAFSLPLWDWDQVFLVESSGDLWIVLEIRNGDHRRNSFSSVEFRIYSFDFSKNRWIRLSNLGDRTVFVGSNCSVAASTSASAPDLLNCKSNSVCFVGTRSKPRWPHGMVNVYLGVYSMERGVSEPLRFGPNAPKCYSFPLWVAPTLY